MEFQHFVDFNILLIFTQITKFHRSFVQKSFRNDTHSKYVVEASFPFEIFKRSAQPYNIVQSNYQFKIISFPFASEILTLRCFFRNRKISLEFSVLPRNRFETNPILNAWLEQFFILEFSSLLFSLAI